MSVSVCVCVCVNVLALSCLSFNCLHLSRICRLLFASFSVGLFVRLSAFVGVPPYMSVLVCARCRL